MGHVDSSPFLEGAVFSFTSSEKLKKQVDFWVSIYSRYSVHQGLIHDSKYIDYIYETVDLRDLLKEGGSIQKRKKKWKLVLLSLHRKQNFPSQLNSEEKKIFDLFKDVNEPNKFLNAARRKRLRLQIGMKEQFLDGLRQSEQYLPQMEFIFKQAGIPRELTRLPFVESSFNVKARSKVGASGVWQFMRSTAQLFLKMNDAVDERDDPIRSTEAAAKLLAMNYASLKSWPLAVTAYNHGRKSMMRGVRRVGSEKLEDLILESRNRSFGFASSNFFAELLAAIEVEKNAEKYFGNIEKEKLIDFVEVRVPDAIHFKKLLHFMKFDSHTTIGLNPSLTEAVLSGQLRIPMGYWLKIPVLPNLSKEQTLQYFLDSYAQIPASLNQKAQPVRKYGRRKGLDEDQVKKSSHARQLR